MGLYPFTAYNIYDLPGLVNIGRALEDGFRTSGRILVGADALHRPEAEVYQQVRRVDEGIDPYGFTGAGAPKGSLV